MILSLEVRLHHLLFLLAQHLLVHCLHHLVEGLRIFHSKFSKEIFNMSWIDTSTCVNSEYQCSQYCNCTSLMRVSNPYGVGVPHC
jgi:hypothetical protein